MNRINIGGNGEATPPQSPGDPLHTPLKPGEVLVRLLPDSTGMAVSVTPHVPVGKLAELLHDATGALVLSEYALFSVFASTVPGKQTIFRMVANENLPAKLAAKLLRVMADGIETGNLPQISG